MIDLVLYLSIYLFIFCVDFSAAALSFQELAKAEGTSTMTPPLHKSGMAAVAAAVEAVAAAVVVLPAQRRTTFTMTCTAG